MRFYWLLLPNLFFAVKGSSEGSSGEGSGEEEDFLHEVVILPTRESSQNTQNTQSTQNTQYSILLGQPSQNSGSFGPERAPSMDPNTLRELGITTKAKPERITPYNFVSIEKFRADGLLDQYKDKPDDLILRLDFEAIETMFEHEPEHSFLISNAGSKALLKVFGSFARLILKLNDVRLNFLAFIIQVYDYAGKLNSDALLQYYTSFCEEFQDIESLRNHIPLMTPIQAVLDEDNHHVFMTGIEFDAHDLLSSEQFHSWNLSSWLFGKRLEHMLIQENEKDDERWYKGLKKEVQDIRDSMRVSLLEVNNLGWLNAFDMLESGDSQVDVAEVAHSWFGFPWNTPQREIDYENIHTSERIKVRFLMYLCIIFPQVEGNKELLSVLVAKVSLYSGNNDMNELEIEFFYNLCITSHQLGSSVLAHYFIRRPRSRMTRMITDYLDLETLSKFEDPVACIQLTLQHEPTTKRCNSEQIFAVRRENELSNQDNPIQEAALAIEEVEQNAIGGSPLIGRKRAVEQVSSGPLKRQATNYESDHFLTETQISRMPGDVNIYYGYFARKLKLVRPDIQYLNARVDYFLQYFEDDSESIDRQKDDQIKDFVQGAFVLVQQLLVYDIGRVDVEWVGFASFGQGLTVEALNLLGKACVLPFLELLHYDKVLKGFVPFPLLAPEMMSLLGALVGLLIKCDFPTDWFFAREYVKFLFYAEPFDQSVAEQATRLYSSIFRNLDEFAVSVGHTDLLDYLPTTFASHYPFEIEYNSMVMSARPFNLYAYGNKPEASPFLRIDALMSKKSLNLLQSHWSEPVEESKTEDADLIESKESEPPKSMESKRLEARIASVTMVKSIMSPEIALRMKQGRFAFQRSFLRNFDIKFWPMLDYERMMRFWEVEKIPFTLQAFSGGFVFEEGTGLTTQLDDEDGRTISATEAFHRILESCSSTDLKQFYVYTTATNYLPTRGLHTNPIKITFLNHLMTRAHTCFKSCDIGVYSQFSLMKKLFFVSIYESENNLEGENRRPLRPIVEIAQVVRSAVAVNLDTANSDAYEYEETIAPQE